MLTQNVSVRNFSELSSISSGKRLTTAVFAAGFGILLVYFTAFSHSELLHNAAHDTRHAIAAPCH